MLKEVMLILTEGCNLSCSYCFEHYKSDKRMKFETAKKIIDAEMKTARTNAGLHCLAASHF